MGLFNRNQIKELARLAFPIIIGQLTDNIISLTDLAYMGRLGNTAISAVGFAGVYYYSFVLVSIGLAGGAQILFARRNGEGRYKAAGRLADHAVVLFITAGLVLSLSMYLVSPLLLRLLLTDQAIIEAAEQYMGIRLLGATFLSLAVAFRGFFIGVKRTRIIIYVPIAAALVNVVLNYVFIFGKFGFPAMGVRGAALASLISEVLLAGGYFITLTRTNYSHFFLFRFRGLSFSYFVVMLRLGLPLMVQSWVAVNSWMLFFVFIERMGKDALAASMIVKQLYILLMIPAWGYGSAVNSLVSNNIGAGKVNALGQIIKNGILVSGGTIVAASLLILVFRQPVFNLFSPDASLHATAFGPFMIVLLAVILFSMANIMFQSIAGIGNTVAVMVIETVVIVIYTLFAALVVYVLKGSLPLVWTAEVVYMVLMLGLSALYLRFGGWRKKLYGGSLSI